MKKIKCYSVRLQSLTSISAKAYKATAFDGSTAILPKSQVFGCDFNVQKSEAYWISCWILEQKNLQYSTKKIGWYNPNTRKVDPNIEIIIEKHIPSPVAPVETLPHQNLVK
jgi:hypothetical protein